MTERKKAVYAKLGIDVPTDVPDFLSSYILKIYNLASRARRYEQGVPLPLRVCDVRDVVAFSPISFDLLFECVFAIDDDVLKSVNKA